MENHIRQIAHGGKNKKLPWGRIPIVIFVGDDMQLPSVEPGVLHLFPYDPEDLYNKYKNASHKNYLNNNCSSNFQKILWK